MNDLYDEEGSMDVEPEVRNDPQEINMFQKNQVDNISGNQQDNNGIWYDEVTEGVVIHNN